MNRDDEVRFIARALRQFDEQVQTLVLLGDRMRQAIVIIEECASVQEVLSEITTEFPRQLDEVLGVLIEILKNQNDERHRIDTGQLIEDLERDRHNSWKRQLLEQHQTLNMLEEQAAAQGSDVDITLTKAIIRTQREIERLDNLLES